MSSTKISRIKSFTNVGITTKSAKILLRENFPLYGTYIIGWLVEYSEVQLPSPSNWTCEYGITALIVTFSNCDIRFR